jgi:hypothetical protein
MSNPAVSVLQRDALDGDLARLPGSSTGHFSPGRKGSSIPRGQKGEAGDL